MSFLYNAFKNAPAIGKKIKKAFSKTDDTITGMKPTTGQKKTRDFKMGAGIKRLNKSIDKLQEFKNK
jgi:hypothetical protein